MTTASAKAPAVRRAALRPKIAKTARWLHIYLSMVSFAIVLFFAVTGITLNHPDWFTSAVTTRTAEGPVPSGAEAPTLIQTIRTREHLHGTPDEPRTDDATISFSFKAPGYTADVTVDRQKSTYNVTEVRNGFVAVINDLHKGRDSGKVWSAVLDLSAILLTLVSLTGLVILFFIYKRRASGLLIAAAGTALGILIYKIFVP